MRKLFLYLIAAVGGLTSPQPAVAQDAFGICESGALQCEALAVEVRKLQLSEELGLTTARINPNFLCPEDTPNCCPPELMPVCMEHGTFIVEQTALSLRAAKNHGDCPWSASVCESLAPFYCGPDSGWNPWEGCTTVAIEPPDFEPPPVCPVGKRWNGKVCIPVPCFDKIFGIEVPCGPIGATDVAVRMATPDGVFGDLLQSDVVERTAREALRTQASEMIEGVSK